MHITCDREKLLSAFQIAATVANARSPKEILQNVKLVADGVHSVWLMATDMENGIRILVDGAEIEKRGAVLLPVARFGLILRENHNDKITIVAVGTETRVSAGDSTFNLPSANPDEYPNVQASTEEAYHEIPASLLREMIKRTAFATDQESSRYALGGVLFELTQESVIAVGTDGRRLAKMQGIGLSVGNHRTVEPTTIVPARSLALVAKAITDCGDDEMVQLTARTSDVVIRTSRSTVVCRLVEGKYPNWRKVIPDRREFTLVDFTVGPLSSAIRQAAIVADAETRGLDFKFAPHELVVSAKTANLGSSRVSINIDYTSESVLLKLDHRYVSDFLRLLDPESKCTANIASSTESVVLTTDDGYTYVVMPMALER